MYFGGTFDYQAEYPAARTLKAPKPSWMQRYNMRLARRDVPKAEAKARTAANLWSAATVFKGENRWDPFQLMDSWFIPRFPARRPKGCQTPSPSSRRKTIKKGNGSAPSPSGNGPPAPSPTGDGLPAPSPDDSVEPAHFVAVWQGDAYAIWKENWGNTIRQWHGMPSPPSCSLDGIVHLYPDTAREIGLGAAHLLVRIKYNVLEIQGSKSFKPEHEEDHPAEDPTEDLDWQSCNGD